MKLTGIRFIRKKFCKNSLMAVVLFTVFCMSAIPAFSQETLTTIDDGNKSDLTVNEENGNDSSKSCFRYTLLYGFAPFTILFGAKSWDWGESHDFKSEKEGWLGKDTDYAGADKVGHLYAHYVMQRSLYDVFDWTENGGVRKWYYSLGTTLSIGLLIEIGDGFTSKYGFSYEDLVFDYIGIFAGALFEYFPLAGGFLGMSADYWPSENFIDQYGDKGIQPYLKFVTDYSGYTYLINFKLAGFSNLGIHLPLVLRLIQFDIGYETRGYSNYDTHAGVTHRERNIRYGISLNSAQLLDESWEWKRGTGYHVAHRTLEYYHIPVQKTAKKEF